MNSVSVAIMNNYDSWQKKKKIQIIFNIMLLGSDSDSDEDVGPRLPSVACRGPKPPEG